MQLWKPAKVNSPPLSGTEQVDDKRKNKAHNMILYSIAPFVAIHFVGGGIHKMDTAASHRPHTVAPYPNYDEIGLQVKILKFIFT